MQRYDWLRKIQQMDPETEFTEIYRISSWYEFPWDTVQSLSFALYRTYAVPGIGRLLAETGEFTGRTQKRYNDTTLILEAVLEHGFDSTQGREAIRRMNQMHRRYDISDADFLYVLATFVVIPKRWLDDYGWRRYSPHERRAATNYFRELGRHMGLPGIPETFEEFEQLLDDYERAHFAFDPGGRAVSDSTLGLMASWYPVPLRPSMRLSSICLLDDPLREAFGYPAPPAALRRAVRTGMWLRGRAVRLLPPRRRPYLARDNRQVRGYPGYPYGYRIGDLGTFEEKSGPAGGCPFPHAKSPESRAAQAQAPQADG
ncbi:oxygenase MpaB family protein [Streptomyces sp. BE20]|uniref:oxygenase MpaB family protein n=1 Tax=Streptomyces sp. BE20 TaxID=3002525 RepID=UPI002E75F182|nr:oxygenase MpaB family protein [Streptomyces sp. BE20]MEE1823521.1 oxygenase MpaB family protein [Streptomyces sp. BE20]